LDGTAPPRSGASAVITQRQRTILPHVTAVQVGQLVEFPNEDDIFHNLFSLSAGNRFSLGRYAPGVTETNVFENPGVVHLFCDIHAEMAGVILVVATPYVARVEPDGAYSVNDVPAGRYRAVAWHPTAGADTATLSIPDAPRVSQDFVLLGGR
jgi:plastocyanin